ncbi:MAG: YihY/virulence factor BrkB family protein [Deltaproteobacteria bacterium]|nr:YihY/virulence factor BrkB family protein [Deltaproteobacteria bacterium]
MLNKTISSSALKKLIWDRELSALPWWKAWLIKSVRICYVVARDLLDGQLTLRAMSLVYTTLLALVPLLAVSFSVLKGFGVHNQIEPMLLKFLSPLGDRGIEITSRIIGFVDNIKAGVLGTLGLALLIYTVISLIQKIESAFNYTWRVKRSRPFAQRFSDYLSIILIGPVLIFTALGITATLTSTALVQKLVAVELFGSVLQTVSHLLPYLLIITAFTFFYILVPNKKVQLTSALIGGSAAGILWEVTGWGFASFVAKSTKYTAIYSGFAILIMFMLWVYLSWLILLVGANIAYYHQHPESLTPERRSLRLSNRLKEKLSLLVMFMVGQNHYHNRPEWSLEDLAQQLRVPADILEPIIESLENKRILVSTAAEPPTLLPGRPLDTTEIKEVLDAVRTANEVRNANLNDLPAELVVDQVINDLDQAIAKHLRGLTVKEFALAEPSTVNLVSQTSERQKASFDESH